VVLEDLAFDVLHGYLPISQLFGPGSQRREHVVQRSTFSVIPSTGGEARPRPFSVFASRWRWCQSCFRGAFTLSIEVCHRNGTTGSTPLDHRPHGRACCSKSGCSHPGPEEHLRGIAPGMRARGSVLGPAHYGGSVAHGLVCPARALSALRTGGVAVSRAQRPPHSPPLPELASP